MSNVEELKEFSLKDAAFEFFKVGCNIVPVSFFWNIQEDKWGKKFPVSGWKKWQSQRQTPGEFEALGLDKAEGFAIICGIKTERGFIVAIDVDNSEFDLSKIRITRTEKTLRGGYHFIYYSKENADGHKNTKLNVELLGKGNLCIMYPSAPAEPKKNEKYSLMNDNDITEIPSIRQLYDDLIVKLGGKAQKTGSQNHEPESTIKPQSLLNRNVRPCFKEMMKKDHLTHEEKVALVNELYHTGYTQEQIETIFTEHKSWEPEPEHGFNAEKTKQMIESIVGKYSRNIREKLSEMQDCLSICPLQSMIDCRDSILELDIEQEIEQEVNRIKDADNQLDELMKHLDQLAVGETNTKKAITVLNLSGKSPNPEVKQIVLLKAEPGSGKSRLMRVLTEGYKVKDVGRFSAHALDYSNLEGFEILRLKELGSMDEEKQGVSTVKFLSSDDQGYAVEITAKDEETGKFTTEQYKIPPITVISSTTRLQLDSQFERRAWLFAMDETPEQTRNIAVWKANLEMQNSEKALGFRKITAYEFSGEVYSRFIERFQFKNVIVPFPHSLFDMLGYDALRVRGDFDKVLNFVKLYAQLNLKRLRFVKGDVYALTPEVAVEALEIVIEPLKSMLSKIDKRTTELFECLKTIVEVEQVHSDKGSFEEKEIRHDHKNASIDKAVREKIAVKLGKSEQTIRRFFSDLETAMYVSSDGKKPKTFTLLYDVSDIEKKLSGLLLKVKSADVLITQMEKEAQEWYQTLSVNLTSENRHSVNFVLPHDTKHESKNRKSVVLSPGGELTNPKADSSNTPLAKPTSDNRLNPKLTNEQQDKRLNEA